jgi:4-amino-4-deoxy-L-arabinose transferase-like glycosyltransferase
MKKARIQLPGLFWFIIIIVLCIPAFLINLGLLPFLEDESIRALVALEMDLSDNFIVPTLNGTNYYAKPPLYNWIIYLSFKVFGGISEWTTRIPTLLFLGLFAASIYHFTKKYLGNKWAFLNALSFVTCGRVLFWESMLGLIDMAYSFVCFVMFMLIFKFFKKEQYTRMFLVSYFLTAIGFLMKGFPSLVFLAISLLVMFVGWKKPKKLFSLDHVYGVGIFIFLVGGYYLIYHLQQGIGQSLNPLLDQATRRTPIAFDFQEVIVHIIEFPFEVIYHFLPWTLLILFLFSRKNRSLVHKHEFFRFCAYLFFFNVLVYWISPQVYPRYLLMLIPLLFTPLWYLVSLKTENWMHNTNRLIFSIPCFIILVSIPCFYWLEIGDHVNYYELILVSTFIILSLLFGWMIFKKHQFFFKFIAFILIVRICFNLIILPDKYVQKFDVVCKEEAIQMATDFGQEDLRLYKDSKVDYTSSFYISATRNKALVRDYDDVNPKALYFIDTLRYEFPAIEKVAVSEMLIREHRRKLFLVPGDEIGLISKK